MFSIIFTIVKLGPVSCRMFSIARVARGQYSTYEGAFSALQKMLAR